MRNEEILQVSVEAAIRIGLMVLLVVWCFQIVQPFVIPIVWGIIIAVAIFPTYNWLRRLVGGRDWLAASLMTIGLLLMVVWPAIMLAGVIVEHVQTVASRLREGTLIVPPPPQGIETWPLIGTPLSKFWTLASGNLTAALEQLAPQIKGFAKVLLGAAADAGIAILQFVAAVILSGIMLAYASGGQRVASNIGRRLAGERGMRLVDLVEATVRSVARGVLGVAVIQALLAGLGFMVAGVPGAGLWTLLCLILGVLQVGVGFVTIPVVIYVFTSADTLTAVLFLIWNIFVGVIDNILKPMLLGRGVDLPMIVIFMGAIGGLVWSGIIGLFVGAVILAMGYKLFVAWLELGEVRAD